MAARSYAYALNDTDFERRPENLLSKRIII